MRRNASEGVGAAICCCVYASRALTMRNTAASPGAELPPANTWPRTTGMTIWVRSRMMPSNYAVGELARTLRLPLPMATTSILVAAEAVGTPANAMHAVASRTRFRAG